MTDLGIHPYWLRGIDEFNRHQFFQSHESWEALWRQCTGPERLFYKGLIQAAVSLFHLQRGNAAGAQKLLARAQQCLAPFRPTYGGLDVERFLAELTHCVTSTLAQQEGEGGQVGELGPTPQIIWPHPPNRPGK